MASKQNAGIVLMNRKNFINTKKNVARHLLIEDLYNQAKKFFEIKTSRLELHLFLSSNCWFLKVFGSKKLA